MHKIKIFYTKPWIISQEKFSTTTQPQHKKIPFWQEREGVAVLDLAAQSNRGFIPKITKAASDKTMLFVKCLGIPKASGKIIESFYSTL